MDIVELSQGLRTLREKFFRTQEVTEKLCAPLSPEDAILSVTADTSPPKWHLGHTSWFYARFILGKFTDFEVTPEFEFIFNSYYKGLGPHIPKSVRSSVSRPALDEILSWRKEVSLRLSDFLESVTTEDLAEVRRILETGINHEEQHQELLLMDIKRNFFENPLRPRYKERELLGAFLPEDPEWINIPSGLVKIGVSTKDPGFHFDNEGDSHQRWIDSFMMMSHPVTNEEYLHFIQEGGYQTPRLWLSDGWDLIQKENWQHPLYWEERDGEWWHFTLCGMVALDLKAPACHLSYYEADAYARFRGARLPTEFEWEVAAGREKINGQFSENHIFEPHVTEEGEEFSAIHGTLWEWTQSAYLPYPRYESFPGALGEYNGKFMVNQMVLRGGSCITPRGHYRKTYRNFYYPHMRWQYAGLRLAKDLA